MYLNYFGFKEAPFNMTPDPRFLFYSQHHREAFDHIVYGIEKRKGFIELTGEVGAGKTTICRAVLARLSPKIKTALVLNPTLTETQLLRAILNDFGLEVKRRDRLAYIETLNRFLLDQLNRGNNVALIVDEAQDLIPGVLEQIRLLSNLETDQNKLLQIVLCGQPELKQRLAAPDLRQLRQRITVRCHLYPLNAEELRQYIDFRLTIAGWQGGELFHSDSIQTIHQYAQGTPRLVNALCDVALLAGYVAGSRQIDGACVKKAIQHLEGTI
jgi:general secretion pathway protein A